MQYSTGFKAQMIKKMTGPNALSANALASEVGVSQGTLSRWLREAATVSTMSDPKRRRSSETEPKRAQEWTPAEKLKVVVEAEALAEEELGGFLRRKGLHRAQLEEWRRVASAAFTDTSTRKGRRSPEQKRIRQLEQQLRRKDKALAETAALLVLKKKLDAVFGDEDDEADPRSED